MSSKFKFIARRIYPARRIVKRELVPSAVPYLVLKSMASVIGL